MLLHYINFDVLIILFYFLLQVPSRTRSDGGVLMVNFNIRSYCLVTFERESTYVTHVIGITKPIVTM